MSAICKKVQSILAAKGEPSQSAKDHLSSCPDCQAMQSALLELGDAIETLPIHDVNDRVITGLQAKLAFQALESERKPTLPRTNVPWIRRGIGYGITGALVSVVAVMLIVRRPMQKFATISRRVDVADSAIKGELSAASPSSPVPLEEANSAIVGEIESKTDLTLNDEEKEDDRTLSRAKVAERDEITSDENVSDRLRQVKGGGFGAGSVQGLEGKDNEVDASGVTDSEQQLGASEKTREILEPRVDEDKSLTLEKALRAQEESEPLHNIPPSASMPQSHLDNLKELALQGGKSSLQSDSAPPPAAKIHSALKDKRADGTEEIQANAFAQLVAERGATHGVRTISARGYFANTYLPSDPVVRAIRSELDRTQHTAADSELAQLLKLDRSMLAPTQPFDAPTDAALGVYVQADRSTLAEEGRMVMQIGIKGSERKSALRQALAVTILVDLRDEIDESNRKSLTALLDAFGQVKMSGDNFRLVLVGRGEGGVIEVDAEHFRHGPLTVALNQALETRAQNSASLEGVLARITSEMSGTVAAGSAQGSSAVVLVAPHIHADKSRLVRRAEESARKGVPISVVTLGSVGDWTQCDEIVFAGQGHRRILADPSEARVLVERELMAQNAIVARAIRLNIKLAPGVKLVGILGSSKLGVNEAKRAKGVESHQDSALAKNFGIAADRGKDDAGIQILIPAFYSGDTHTVLLDLITDGKHGREGQQPIADVSVRFKDLLQLKNQSIDRAFALPRGKSEPLWQGGNALQANVIKNFITYQVSERLKSAGAALAKRHTTEAQSELASADEVIGGVRQMVAALRDDPDLEASAQLIARYRAMLARANGPQLSLLIPLGQSLQLRAYDAVRGVGIGGMHDKEMF